MDSIFPSLLAQWREASRRALEAERQLFDAALQYAKGSGPQPTDEFMDEVKRLRHEAGELFKQAMAESGCGGARPYPPPDRHAQH